MSKTKESHAAGMLIDRYLYPLVHFVSINLPTQITRSLTESHTVCMPLSVCVSSSVSLPSMHKSGFAVHSTYEDYLDSQITRRDLMYLQDEELARQLVELGYRGSAETLSRDEFDSRKRELEEQKYKSQATSVKVLSSSGKDLTGRPFLQALAAREEMVRDGKLTCILYIRDKNTKGQEVSGYIDFAHRLRTEDFSPYFTGQKRLLPRPSDLSYYNWEAQTATSNPTPNLQVIADSEHGLLFKNKRDRKVINVDPSAASGNNSIRHEVDTTEYIQVVIYDHMTRRKS
jgi:cilia- and flagella-associated protein 299